MVALHRPHRVPRRGERAGGAAHRADLHQAVQAALQHPAARRQVLSLHRHQPRRGLPARLLHARAPPPRPRLLRPLLEREARARDARPARQDLPVPLLRGRRAGPPLGLAVPRLLHQALRGALRRLRLEGGVPGGDRRRHRLPLRPLPPDRARPRAPDVLRRGRAGLRAGGGRAQPPAGRRASCWSASASRRRARGRSTRSPSPSTGWRPTPRSSRCATACCPTASPSTSTTRASRAGDRGGGVPAPVLHERAGHPVADRRRAGARGGLGARGARRAAVASGAAARWRSARPSAAASGASSSWRSATRGSRSTRRSSRPSAGASSASTRSPACRRALGLDALPVRIECFDISNLGGTHTVASMVVFEGGAPKKADYRRFTIRTVEGSDDFASMAEVLSRRYAAWEAQHERRPYDADRDASFAALPNLIVIDGGAGPAVRRAAGRAGLPRARRRGDLARQADRGGLPARRAPAAAPAARHAGAAAAPARARRGPSLRHHPPPHPPRQGDDGVDHGRPPRRRPGAQARAAASTSARPRRCSAPAASSSRRSPASRRRSPATSTPTSTRPADEHAPARPRRRVRLLRAPGSRRP